MKGPIEKGAIDGQLAYGSDLVKSLKAGMSSRPRAATTTSKGPKGKKKRKGDSKSATSPKESESSSKTHYDPLRGIIGPIVDLAGPLISTNTVIVILLSLLLYTWLRAPIRSSTSALDSAPLSSSSAARLTAYEEMWRKEESELWSWLEDRVGIQGLALNSQGPSSSKASKKSAKEQAKKRNKILASKDMAARLREEKMSEREVEDAIRVTQERLDVLKGVVEKKKQQHQGDGEASAKGQGEEEEAPPPAYDGTSS